MATIAIAPEDQGHRRHLGRDLAEELGFPADTNLAKISQVELHGVSWNTDPYKRLLWRCIHNTLLKPYPAVASPSHISYTAASHAKSYDTMDDDERLAVPTNPPPSPAVGPIDRLNSTITSTKCTVVSIQEVPYDDLETSSLDSNDCDDEQRRGYDCLSVETDVPLLDREPDYERYEEDSPLPDTGFLAAIKGEDGTLTWHFKDLS